MTENYEKIRIDKIFWHIKRPLSTRIPEPLCPIHNLRLSPVYQYGMSHPDDSKILKCEECSHTYPLPRSLSSERKYILDKIDAKRFEKMKVLNLDDEYLPLSEEKLSSDDKKFFVTGRLTKSKVGLRLVIYAGKKGSTEKTQIFVEPELKRLAFDQKDLHPTDVFTKVEATFNDNSKSSFEKKLPKK